MNYSKITLLFATLLTLTNCAGTGASAEGTAIAPETMRPLATWVAQETHVQMAALPIAVASGIRLKTALGLEGASRARAVAAYIPGQIYINNVIWDPASTVSQSYLLHELVHHAQLLGGKTYPCHAAKEREAYILQNKWLAQHGESPVVNEDWIERISACPAHEAHQEVASMAEY